MAMTKSTHTIDRLVERFGAVKPVIEQIAHSLGSAEVDTNGRATVQIDMPPFEGADIEEFRGVIKINFRIAAGTWRFKDITDKPELWSVGPALPRSEEHTSELQSPYVISYAV